MNGEKRSQEKLWEIDIGYRQYVSAHHPEAIEFIKKNADNFKSKHNIWLDIRNYDTFSGLAPDNSRLPGTRDVILFKRIIFDVFPRKLHPQYIKGDGGNRNIDVYNYNRYITWKTATEDIANQRSQGYKGEHWVVECGFDMKKAADTTRQVRIPESHKRVDNPKYGEYLRSPLYLECQKSLTVYTEQLSEYNSFRKNFHDFALPDGTTKKILFYNRPEEKFAMLRESDVPEEVLNRFRAKLVKPSEPTKPSPPPREIWQSIPAHYEEQKVLGKWTWRHYIKTVQKK